MFARVLWRQKRLVLAGMAVALVLSVLAGYRVTSEGLAPRAERRYTSVSSIFVAGEQGGAFRAVSPRSEEEAAKPGEDPGDLADVYAQLVVSDEVRQRVERVYGSLEEKKSEISAFRQVARAPRTGVGAGRPRPLPFVEINATAPDPGNARRLAQLTAETFLRFVDEQQVAAGIPPNERVSLELARRGTSGRLTGRSPLALVALLFVGFMTFFVALAAILHNVGEHRRRRAGEPAPGDDWPSEDDASQRWPAPPARRAEPEESSGVVPVSAPPSAAAPEPEPVASSEAPPADQVAPGSGRSREPAPTRTAPSAMPWWQVSSVSSVDEPQTQMAVPDPSHSAPRREESGPDSW